MNRGSVWGKSTKSAGNLISLMSGTCRQRLALFSSLRARLAAAAHGCRDKSTTDELAARRGEDRRHFIGVWRPAMDCRGHAEDDARSSSRQSRVVRELSLVSPPPAPPPPATAAAPPPQRP